MRMTLLLRYIICPLVGPRTIGGVPSEGGLSKGFYPVITRVSENTTENSEQLGRQARPGFEPGTSRLPVLGVKIPPLVGPVGEGNLSPNNFLKHLKINMNSKSIMLYKYIMC